MTVFNAKDVSFNEKHIVKVKNIQARWIVHAKNVKSLDGEQWLKVVSRSHSLVNMITQDNEHIGAGSSGPVYNHTLAASRGLANLTKLRNHQQSKDLIEHAKQSQVEKCTLFGTSTKKPKINFSKHSKQLNAQECCMFLEPEPGKSITILRPCRPGDCLWVLKDPDSIANLISYIRSEGFDSSLVASEKPKHIHRRGQKFVVKYIKEDGSNGWKTLSTLEAAVAYQETKQAAAESDAREPVEAEDEKDSEELVEAEGERAADEPV